MRAISFGRSAILLIALRVSVLIGDAQSEVPPKWEAVSIKQCPPEGGGRGGHAGGLHVSPGRLSAVCLPLTLLIADAYATYARDISVPSESVPISGGPTWLSNETYEIEAKAEGNPPANTMEGAMLQALLENRFMLKVRRQTKEIAVYELRVAKNGIRIQPMAADSCASVGSSGQSGGGGGSLEHCGSTRYGRSRDGIPAFVEYHGMSFDQISANLIQVLDRPVINKTGVPGLFHFHVDFAPDGTIPKFAPTISDDIPPGASFFTALEKQLGLKLEPARGPGEFLVIEHIERPSAN